jgi:hypothetical protein
MAARSIAVLFTVVSLGRWGTVVMTVLGDRGVNRLLVLGGMLIAENQAELRALRVHRSDGGKQDDR